MSTPRDRALAAIKHESDLDHAIDVLMNEFGYSREQIQEIVDETMEAR